MSSRQCTQIQINKQNLSDSRLEQTEIDFAALTKDDIVLEVDGFGLSANNVTYAMLGDIMGYWGFFPAPEGWGITPVWGYANIIHSSIPELPVGERVYGYLPMATHLVVRPQHVTPHGFNDGHPQRKSISPVYDQYVLCSNDPSYDASQEGLQANFKPLFTTSFVLKESVLKQVGDGDQQVVITSASSKTALGTAFLLYQAKQTGHFNGQIVGLTSASNLAFVEGLSCYDKVISYEDWHQVDGNNESLVLDFAGNKGLLLSLSQHLSEHLQKIWVIGVTDVQAQAEKPQGQLNSEMFFAPAVVKDLLEEWGKEEFAKRYMAAWMAFSKALVNQFALKNVKGAEALREQFETLVKGSVSPQQLLMIHF